MASALYDELTAGPLASQILPFISAGDDGAISVLMNTQNISVTSSLPADTFAIWCAVTGMRAVIQDQSALVTSPVRSSALSLLDLLQGNLHPSSLDLSNGLVVSMLNAWVTSGLLTADTFNSLIALAQKQISRAQQIGITCDANAIGHALRG
jgi:hypothetical protein